MSKFIVFEFYEVFVENSEGTALFDFTRLIHLASKLNKSARAKTNKGVTARFETCRFIEDRDIWAARFMRMRKEDIPFLITETEDAEDIVLEKDEYIGEDVNLLFDPQRNIIMMQRNRRSLPPSRLQSYINCLWSLEHDGEAIYFSPITKNLSINNYRKKQCRSLELSVSDLNSLIFNGETDVGKIFKSYGNFGAHNAKIVLSLGRVKKNRKISLNEESVGEVFDFISKNYVNISSAKLKCLTDDCDVETVDLLEDKVNVVLEISFENEKQHKSPEFDYIITKMLEAFAEQESVLANIRK